jgi:hypothetical protein
MVVAADDNVWVWEMKVEVTCFTEMP